MGEGARERAFALLMPRRDGMDDDAYDDSGTPTPTPVRMPPFDPMEAEITGIAGGPAIPATRLSADRLRRLFASPRPWQPEPTDETIKPRFRNGATDYVPASVLVPIVLRERDDADGPTMLFTQRTAHLNAHAGQVSFPGGSAEPSDADAAATALRETEEEIGLARDRVEVIGRLTDYRTVTGFRVANIVGLVHRPFTLTLDAFEVESAFEVPLTFLLDPANHQRRIATMDDGDQRRFTAMPYGDHFIWGATAAMLRNFYLFMLAHEGD
jgi:8-oxo-dGTP pyrophosphatase MutT (NUDIX family)